MDDAGKSDATYVLGRSAEETHRLERQSEILYPHTRRLFQEAGIGTGMKVLDVGSGAGDVAFIAADLVGSTGRVVGVDTNAAILETARTRALVSGLTHVSFQAGDIRTTELDRDFDAVVGRLVLIYHGDAGETLRVLSKHVRSGGILAFHEITFSSLKDGRRSVPPSPLYEQVIAWVYEAFQRTGAEMDIGFKLPGAFRAAGLPSPQIDAQLLMGSGPSWPGWDYLATTLRSVIPYLERFGIATSGEVDIETCAQRMRDESVRLQSTVQLAVFPAVWARKP
jgi:2-polyprenyl-3-methyl-5-hydroxy-6-metoxy-1,4-benzoquinol methylase